MSDREALADLLVAHPALPTYNGHLGRYRCPKCGVEINGSCNSPSHAEHQADAILASDWLRERDKQIAREVEALVREETKTGIAGLLDESVVGLAKWHLVQLVREWEPKSNGNGGS